MLSFEYLLTIIDESSLQYEPLVLSYQRAHAPCQTPSLRVSVGVFVSVSLRVCFCGSMWVCVCVCVLFVYERKRLSSFGGYIARSSKPSANGTAPGWPYLQSIPGGTGRVSSSETQALRECVSALYFLLHQCSRSVLRESPD